MHKGTRGKRDVDDGRVDRTKRNDENHHKISFPFFALHLVFVGRGNRQLRTKLTFEGIWQALPVLPNVL
jgi:hypothetical protein